jgi:ferric-dicitrate binding protein FerR (iron transport regulator)
LWNGRVRRAKEPPTVNKGKTPPTEPLTPGERRAMRIAVGVVVGAIAAGSTAWVMTDHSSDPYDRSGDGCVNVTFASSMGGALQHACGAAARDWCRAVYAQHDAHAEAVQAQCRVAGILP